MFTTDLTLFVNWKLYYRVYIIIVGFDVIFFGALSL